MKKTGRFEIPIDTSEYNLFAIDDYLREIGTPEGRRKLIGAVGYSARLRERYEKKHGLPRGAVELAMMAEDKRVKELSDKIAKRLTETAPEKVTPQEAKAFYLEVDSMMVGIRTLYPEAMQFVKEYATLSQRNKLSFRGEYHFSNDYKILQAAACPGPPPDPCTPSPWWCTEVFVYTWSLVAWAIFLAGAISLVVAVFVAAVAWVLICVAVPVQVPPCAGGAVAILG
jgi:hypothetical protein